MVTSYCPLSMMLQRSTFQLHPNVLQAADGVPPFCTLPLLSAAVLVSGSSSCWAWKWQNSRIMFQVSFQTVQEHLGMAGNPLRCLACGTCPWQTVKQVLIHPEKFVTISWVNIIIFRYLLLSLRANRDPLDSVDKARQILQVLLQWSWLWST